MDINAQRKLSETSFTGRTWSIHHPRTRPHVAKSFTEVSSHSDHSSRVASQQNNEVKTLFDDGKLKGIFSPIIIPEISFNSATPPSIDDLLDDSSFEGTAWSIHHPRTRPHVAKTFAEVSSHSDHSSRVPPQQNNEAKTLFDDGKLKGMFSPIVIPEISFNLTTPQRNELKTPLNNGSSKCTASSIRIPEAEAHVIESPADVSSHSNVSSRSARPPNDILLDPSTEQGNVDQLNDSSFAGTAWSIHHPRTRPRVAKASTDISSHTNHSARVSATQRSNNFKVNDSKVNGSKANDSSFTGTAWSIHHPRTRPRVAKAPSDASSHSAHSGRASKEQSKSTTPNESMVNDPSFDGTAWSIRHPRTRPRVAKAPADISSHTDHSARVSTTQQSKGSKLNDTKPNDSKVGNSKVRDSSFDGTAWSIQHPRTRPRVAKASAEVSSSTDHSTRVSVTQKCDDSKLNDSSFTGTAWSIHHPRTRPRVAKAPAEVSARSNVSSRGNQSSRVSARTSASAQQGNGLKTRNDASFDGTVSSIHIARTRPRIAKPPSDSTSSSNGSLRTPSQKSDSSVQKTAPRNISDLSVESDIADEVTWMSGNPKWRNFTGIHNVDARSQQDSLVDDNTAFSSEWSVEMQTTPISLTRIRRTQA